MKVLVVEDEKIGFQNLCRLLRQLDPTILIDGPITNTVDLKRVIKQQPNYDIIFCDTQLEDRLQKSHYSSRLLVKSFDGSSVLPVSDISFITFEEGKVIAYTHEGTHFTLPERTLDAVLSRLDPKVFFRANRQYIIHIEAIKKIHTGFRQTEKIELQHYKNVSVDVSKDRVPEFHVWIEQS